MVEVRKSRFKWALPFVAVACLAGPLARADSVLPPGPVTVLEHTQLVGGSFSSAFDFLVPAAGTISVTLIDMVWPDTLSSLSFSAASATSILKSLSGPGSMSFDVTTPGHYFAIVSGAAQGAFDLGLYSFKLTWSALDPASPSSVPLPTAGWLLLAGVACLAILVRRRESAHAGQERMLAMV